VPHSMLLHRRPDTKRRFGVATVTATVLALLVSTSALAVTKSVSTHDNPVWLTDGVWGSWTHFGSTWDVTKIQDAGKTWWWVTKLEMSGTVRTAANCPNCRFSLEAKAEFLNANNAVLHTVTPPPGNCRPYYKDPASAVVVKCAPGPYQFSLSVTKVKFTWRMQLINGWGNSSWTQWVTRTVNM
jgi:hypothetical protein